MSEVVCRYHTPFQSHHDIHTLEVFGEASLLQSSITFKASILQHHSAAAALVRQVLGDRMSSFLVSWSFLTNSSH